MLQTIPKWRVTVRVDGREIVFWIYASSFANVLRTIADVQFTETGLELPTELCIQRADLEAR